MSDDPRKFPEAMIRAPLEGFAEGYRGFWLLGAAAAPVLFVLGVTFLPPVASAMSFILVGGSPWPVAVAMAVAAFVLDRTVALPWIHRRVGTVVLYKDKIRIEKPTIAILRAEREDEEEGPDERILVVPLADFVGFRDDSEDFVQLVRKKETLASSYLTIPTRTAEDRTTVLEYLARHGLARLE